MSRRNEPAADIKLRIAMHRYNAALQYRLQLPAQFTLPLTPLSKEDIDRLSAVVNRLPVVPPFSMTTETIREADEEEFICYQGISTESKEIIYLMGDDGLPLLSGVAEYGTLMNIALEAIRARYGIEKYPWERETVIGAKEDILEYFEKSEDVFLGVSNISDRSSRVKYDEETIRDAICFLLTTLLEKERGVPARIIANLSERMISRLHSCAYESLEIVKLLVEEICPEKFGKRRIGGLADIVFLSLANAPASRGSIYLRACPLCGKLFFPDRKANQKVCNYIGNPNCLEDTCSSAWNNTLRKRVDGWRVYREKTKLPRNTAEEHISELHLAMGVLDEVLQDNKYLSDKLTRIIFLEYMSLHELFCAPSKREKCKKLSDEGRRAEAVASACQVTCGVAFTDKVRQDAYLEFYRQVPSFDERVFGSRE